MNNQLEAIRDDVLGSKFVKAYFEQPVIGKLYDVKMSNEGDKYSIQKTEVNFPSFNNLEEQERLARWRKLTAENLLGDFYHTQCGKSINDVLLPKVHKAWKRFQETPYIEEADKVFRKILSDELGESRRYLSKGHELASEWSKLKNVVSNGTIDAQTARISADQKAENWCSRIETERGHALAYIFASSRPDAAWSRARDMVVMYAGAKGHDMSPFLEVWHAYPPAEAIKRISDFRLVPQPKDPEEEHNPTQNYIW
ncbi:MAG: hypothetical protein V1887_02945 [Candidatus Aenigmatarchaeota archaeon]